MIDAKQVAQGGCKYLGTPYSVIDCQAFVEKVLKDCGEGKNLAGSNAWYRYITKHGWTGSPDECKAKYGTIPAGAFLFILSDNGNEPARYQGDGVGNASHIGIYTGLTGNEMVSIGKAEGDAIAAGFNYGNGAIHSSSSRGAVCTSNFAGKSINGGWNRIGLWLERIKYEGIEQGGDEKVTYQAKVVGGNLNMREQPQTNAERLCQIPDGTILTVTDEALEWAKTSYSGHTGWVMKKYLEEISLDSDMVSVSRKELEDIYDRLGDWLGLRG